MNHFQVAYISIFCPIGQMILSRKQKQTQYQKEIKYTATNYYLFFEFTINQQSQFKYVGYKHIISFTTSFDVSKYMLQFSLGSFCSYNRNAHEKIVCKPLSSSRVSSYVYPSGLLFHFLNSLLENMNRLTLFSPKHLKHQLQSK